MVRTNLGVAGRAVRGSAATIELGQISRGCDAYCSVAGRA